MIAAVLTARVEQAVLTVTVARPNRATVGELRTWLTGYLLRRGHGGDAADSALLILSELATNAVLYGDGSLAVTAHLNAGVLTLTVTDRINPKPGESAGDEEDRDEHGRGLLIVHALADSATETVHDGRHTVAVTLDLGGAS